MTLALSIGLVITNRNDEAEAEFIAGPTLGFIKDRMFVTFGFHAG